MKLSNSFTSVTPFSKILALSLFIILPFVAFYLGMQYQKGISPSVIYVTKEKIVSVKRKETTSDLFRRCGDFPKEAQIFKEHFDIITGRVWSPDCKNIAWALWTSGTSWLGEDTAWTENIPTASPRPYLKEGLYVFNDAERKIQQVYKMKVSDQTIEFKEWKDRNTIIFSTNNGTFSYKITTGVVKLL